MTRRKEEERDPREKCQTGFNYVTMPTVRETIVFWSVWWIWMMRDAMGG